MKLELHAAKEEAAEVEGKKSTFINSKNNIVAFRQCRVMICLKNTATEVVIVGLVFDISFCKVITKKPLSEFFLWPCGYSKIYLHKFNFCFSAAGRIITGCLLTPLLFHSSLL